MALNNVAMPNNPPCISLLQKLSKDPRYLRRVAVNSSLTNGTNGGPFVGVNYVNATSRLP